MVSLNGVERGVGTQGEWRSTYGQDLEVNLRDLHGRLLRGAYRAKPSRRVQTPKADGRQRPLAIAALEDKTVQRAFVEVLGAIYEKDFLGFSFGFHSAAPLIALVYLCCGGIEIDLPFS